MSWGYVPKKLKQARRQKRLRKKYKDFSCLTCAYGERKCPKDGSYYHARSLSGKPITKNCDCWKMSTEAKHGKRDINITNKTDKKQPGKGLLSKLFNN